MPRMSAEEWHATFNEDGSARDPVAFREKIMADKEILKELEVGQRVRPTLT